MEHIDTNIKEIESFNPKKHMNKTTRTREQGDPRSPIIFGTGSRFNLPSSFLQKLKDEDKVAGFIPYEVANEEQRMTFEKAIDRGWRPLDSREYPELTRQYSLSPFAKREEDYLVRRGGQLAMIRDKEVDDAERDWYDSEKKRQEITTAMHRVGSQDPRGLRIDTDQRNRERMRF